MEQLDAGQNTFIQKQGESVSNDRYMKLAIANRNLWRMIAVLIVIIIITVMWLGKIGSQSKFVPVYVEVDKLANIVKVDLAGKSKPFDPSKVLSAEISRTIEDMRMVVGDRLLQKKMKRRLYAKVQKNSAAKAFLDDMFEKRDPFEISKSMTIDVQIVSKLASGESGKTWEVEWTEQKIDPRGQKIGEPERFRTVMITDIMPIEREDVIELNPIGLFLSTINLAKKI